MNALKNALFGAVVIMVLVLLDLLPHRRKADKNGRR